MKERRHRLVERVEIATSSAAWITHARSIKDIVRSAKPLGPPSIRSPPSRAAPTIRSSRRRRMAR
jgi:hypothetical protein